MSERRLATFQAADRLWRAADSPQDAQLLYELAAAAVAWAAEAQAVAEAMDERAGAGTTNLYVGDIVGDAP